jgi:cobalt/nickel transport system permease protein
LRRFDPAPVSRGPGLLHSIDPRTRLVSALTLLVGISLATTAAGFLPIAAVIAASLLAARLRPRPALLRAIAVVALPSTFVILNYLGGETHRAGLLLTRTLLSAGVILVLTAVTSLPELSTALSRLGAPDVLTETVTLLYRYLFVLTDQAMRMRDAVSCRGGSGSLLAAGGTVGVLFARSYGRAESVHRAMLSRGYTGKLPELEAAKFGIADLAALSLCGVAAFAGSLMNAAR